MVAIGSSAAAKGVEKSEPCGDPSEVSRRGERVGLSHWLAPGGDTLLVEPSVRPIDGDAVLDAVDGDGQSGHPH